MIMNVQDFTLKYKFSQRDKEICNKLFKSIELEEKEWVAKLSVDFVFDKNVLETSVETKLSSITKEFFEEKKETEVLEEIGETEEEKPQSKKELALAAKKAKINNQN